MRSRRICREPTMSVDSRAIISARPTWPGPIGFRRCFIGRGLWRRLLFTTGNWRAGWLSIIVRSKTREPGLNSFAQFPVRSDATPQSTETPPSAETSEAEDAPSRPIEPIADRVPAADGLVTASLDGTASATNDAPESRVASVADAIPATQDQGTGKIDDTAGGLHIRFALPLLLALCSLSALVLFWGWFRGRTQTAASANPLMILMLDRNLCQSGAQAHTLRGQPTCHAWAVLRTLASYRITRCVKRHPPPVGQAKTALGGSCVQIDFANRAVTAASLAAD